MHGALIRTLGLALLVLCLGCALAVAETKTTKGKIHSINKDGKGFTLQVEGKKPMSFKTPRGLLDDLKPGDEVLVTVDAGKVIAVSPDKGGGD